MVSICKQYEEVIAYFFLVYTRSWCSEAFGRTYKTRQQCVAIEWSVGFNGKVFSVTFFGKKFL